MLNEERVRLMTRMACYEAKEGRKNVAIGNFFRGDYIGLQVIKSVISATIAYILIFAMFILYDFEVFMEGLHLTRNDFVFLDPPYDSDFSTYAQNIFGREEQIRLCECLRRTPAKILLVIKNTDFIRELYQNDFRITSFSKRYLVSFMNRNERDATHLIITNY